LDAGRLIHKGKRTHNSTTGRATAVTTKVIAVNAVNTSSRNCSGSRGSGGVCDGPAGGSGGKGGTQQVDEGSNCGIVGVQARADTSRTVRVPNRAANILRGGSHFFLSKSSFYGMALSDSRLEICPGGRFITQQRLRFKMTIIEPKESLRDSVAPSDPSPFKPATVR
jgi:hypothetical protein